MQFTIKVSSSLIVSNFDKGEGFMCKVKQISYGSVEL